MLNGIRSFAARVSGPFKSQMICGMAAAAIAAGMAGSVKADSLSLGSAADYAGLSLQGVPFTISSGNTVITGNVGVGQGGSLNFSGGGQISGQIRQDPTASVNISGGSAAAGGVVTTSLAQAQTDALNAASAAAALAPTQTFSSIGNNTNSSISGTAGQNVIDVSGDISLSGGHALTLNGTPSSVFIIDVAGTITLSGGSKIVLGSGVSASNVLFNFVGKGQGLNFNGNSVTEGTFLAPQRDITVSGGVHDGGFISGTQLKFQSGPKVEQASFVPLPAPLIPVAVLFGAVAVGGEIARRKRTAAAL